MCVKKTQAGFEKEVFELVGSEYRVNGKYSGTKKEVSFYHSVCKENVSIRADWFLKGGKCTNCTQSERVKKFANDVETLGDGDYELLEDFEHYGKNVLMKHKTCGNVWKANTRNFLNGRRCMPCSVKGQTKTHSKYVEEVKELVKDEYSVVGEYMGKDRKVEILHNVCGKVNKVNASSFIQGSRCPHCNESKGESRISKYMDLNLYNYKFQHKINECRDKRVLPFDFAVFNEGKLICLIEYEGIQHFEPVKFFGGVENLRVVQRRDGIKREFCKSKGIKLIEIPYWEKENVESILDEELNTLFKSKNIKKEQLEMF